MAFNCWDKSVTLKLCMRDSSGILLLLEERSNIGQAKDTADSPTPDDVLLKACKGECQFGLTKTTYYFGWRHTQKRVH